MPADFADRTDFENANRGLIARLEPGVIKAADGRVVYDADAFTRATTGDCPDTVHPSLWRQSQLTAIQGLFEVTEGIYQLRGIELSNMTLVEGKTGVIVIDPAVSAEVAAAGLALYREHRGDRPVTAVIYTHSHIDHFGGVLGVVDAGTSVPIVAPEGFLDHAVSENVYAGEAMLRRGAVPHRHEPADQRDRHDRGRARPRHLDGHVRAARAHARHHQDRAGGDARRGADRLPDHARAPRRRRR